MLSYHPATLHAFKRLRFSRFDAESQMTRRIVRFQSSNFWLATKVQVSDPPKAERTTLHPANLAPHQTHQK